MGKWVKVDGVTLTDKKVLVKAEGFYAGKSEEDRTGIVRGGGVLLILTIQFSTGCDDVSRDDIEAVWDDEYIRLIEPVSPALTVSATVDHAKTGTRYQITLTKAKRSYGMVWIITISNLFVSMETTANPAHCGYKLSEHGILSGDCTAIEEILRDVLMPKIKELTFSKIGVSALIDDAVDRNDLIIPDDRQEGVRNSVRCAIDAMIVDAIRDSITE